MSRILLITSSPRGADSLSTRFATQIAEAVQIQTDGTLAVRDLATDPLQHISADYIEGRSAVPGERLPSQIEAVNIAQQLVDELKAADVVVIGSAMINFGPPSQLKAWFDHVIWPGVTFAYGDTGPQGLLTGKKVYLVSAAGAIYSEGPAAPFDFQTNYLQHLLGFIGLTDVELVRVEGAAFGPEAAQAVIVKTEATVQSLIKEAA